MMIHPLLLIMIMMMIRSRRLLDVDGEYLAPAEGTRGVGLEPPIDARRVEGVLARRQHLHDLLLFELGEADHAALAMITADYSRRRIGRQAAVGGGRRRILD